MRHGPPNARQAHIHCDLCGLVITVWNYLFDTSNKDNDHYHVCPACVQKHFITYIKNHKPKYQEEA